MRALNDVPPERRCNATTRAGTPCKKWAERGRTRCKFHGGKSYRGIASPRLAHGWYSTDPIYRLRRVMIEAHERRQARLRELLAERGIETDTP